MTHSKELSYGTVQLYNDQILGVGAYGKVCRAKCGPLPCAAKVLHDTLFQHNNPEIENLTRKFEEECQLLSSIKHPNIVQHLHTTRDPDFGRQVLLMELMDESLTKFLERSLAGPLPFHIQVNICHDVALALSYLHLNGIIHRDLSSNNVLLIGEGSRAKVADFGMSKLLDLNPHMTPLSQCPGTPAYMPPEALIKPPHYTDRLDCFSHGVLAIQIATKKFPDPDNAMTAIDISGERFPTGRAFVPVPEADRRKRDIDLMRPDHSLKQIVLDCLKDRDTERPSADELCEQLAVLMRELKFTDSLVHGGNQGHLLKKFEMELEEKEAAIKLSKAQILEYEVNSDGSAREIAASTDKNSVEPYHSRVFGLIWTQREPAPEDMASKYGSAILHNNNIYISQEYTIYRYKMQQNRWKAVMEHMYKEFSLAVVNDRLTTIGGFSNDGLLNTYTNLLFTLVGSGSSRKFEDTIFPPMPTHRHCHASVTTPTHLVVAGGKALNRNGIDVVEAMNTETLQWATVQKLPRVARHPKLTLFDGCLYIMADNMILYSTAEQFLQSCEQPSEEHSTITRTNDSFWTRVADIPVNCGASLVTLGGHMLAIGGRDTNRMPNGSIFCYNRVTNSWTIIGELSIPRYDTLSVCSKNKEVFIMGGYTSIWDKSAVCEVGSIIW